jgi:hypothetical protein
VSAVARAAAVDRSFLYRHHDLRAQIHVQAATAPGTSPASTAASRQSLLADLANLQEQNQRRRQNLALTARLSEALGAEVFHESGIGHPGESGQLRSPIAELEQHVLGQRQQLQERTDELDAARAANRDLMALANQKKTGPG